MLHNLLWRQHNHECVLAVYSGVSGRGRENMNLQHPGEQQRHQTAASAVQCAPICYKVTRRPEQRGFTVPGTPCWMCLLVISWLWIYHLRQHAKEAPKYVKLLSSRGIGTAIQKSKRWFDLKNLNCRGLFWALREGSLTALDRTPMSTAVFRMQV